MRAKERMNLAYGQRNSLSGFFPRKHADLSPGREHGALHGDSVGVRRDFIRQDQNRVLAIPGRATGSDPVRDDWNSSVRLMPAQTLATMHPATGRLAQLASAPA